MTKAEELAIIKDVGFGVRDVGTPVLYFTVDFLNGSALQIINSEDAIALLKKHQIYDVKNLNGRACIVETEGKFGGLVKFVDLK